jgi:hypothetical protein
VTRWLCILSVAASARAEQAERRDQNCHLFEGDHLRDVEDLRSTYKYLNQLTAVERRTAINQAILRSLPMAEGEARVDRAPDYCDAPGVGLPEPDPVVPDRPLGL